MLNQEFKKFKLNRLYIVTYKTETGKTKSINILPVISNGENICCLVDNNQSREFQKVILHVCGRDNLPTYKFSRGVKCKPNSYTNTNTIISSATTCYANTIFHTSDKYEDYLIKQKDSKLSDMRCCSYNIQEIRDRLKSGSIISIIKKSRRIKLFKEITTKAYKCAGWCHSEVFSGITDIKKATKLRLF
jgi:hypothetical protein